MTKDDIPSPVTLPACMPPMRSEAIERGEAGRLPRKRT